VLAARSPLLICPAMDGEMWNAPSVQSNLKKLKQQGVHIFEPEEGYLASGLNGRGRLPEPGKIVAESERIVSTNEKGPLSGKSVLLTAGPPREYIDPVRFLSNPSSGKMGFAMARAAKQLGGDVILLHGAVSLKLPQGIKANRFE